MAVTRRGPDAFDEGAQQRSPRNLRRAVTLYATAVHSPVGPLGVAVRDEGIAWVGRVPSLAARPGRAQWPEEAVDPVGRLGVRVWVWEREPDITGPLVDAVQRYFAGEPDAFRLLPVAPAGTPFQLAVWEACAAIPFARTAEYGDLAVQVGSPRAARAVGQAMQRNPVPLVVPCHRVLGAQGALVGYSMGGTGVKRWLLEHESRAAERAAPSFPGGR